jgi:non-ribosomal peptide synthetase component F
MNDAERRIASLSPEQRELLMRRMRERGGAQTARRTPEVPKLPEGAVDRHAPVPPTDFQEALWLSRSGLFDLGGCGSNVYLEYEFPGIVWQLANDLSNALRALVERHEALRTIVLPDGRLQLLAQVPPYEVEVEDLSGRSAEKREQHLLAVRDELRYARRPTDRWPLFEIVLHQLDEGKIRLHARFDLIVIDGAARGVLLSELVQILNFPDQPLQELDVSFLDHARALDAFRQTETYARARAYWMERLPHLPPPPVLPLARPLSPEDLPRAVKRQPEVLGAEDWTLFCSRAARAGITPTTAVTAAFAEVLRLWSAAPEFSVGFGGTYRPEIHPHIARVLGSFTIIHLLGFEDGPGSFLDRARRLQDRIASDLQHQDFSGHQVLREYNRLHRIGARSAMPIQLNSVVEYGRNARTAAPPPPSPDAPEGTAAPAPQQPMFQLDLTEVDLLAALPMVLLFWVVLENLDGGLSLVSQAVEELLPEDLVPEMIEAYSALLARLATQESAWSEERPAQPRGTQSEALSAAGMDAALPDLVRRLELGPGDRFFSLAPDGSELALADRLASKAAGATLVLPEPGAERDPARLAALAARHQVTVWSSPPALLEAVVTHAEKEGRRAAFPPLRLALLHRETAPATLAARLEALCRGARIASIWSSPEVPLAAVAGPAAPAEAIEPRFEPLAGRRLQVLDAKGGPRAVWASGDLWAGGPDAPLVRTGERAQLLPDGRIALRGTGATGPVEALGYGSETRFIETALQRHPDLRHALVEWRAQGERGRLVAWVLPRPDRPPSAADLHRHLRAAGLPEHLVPDSFTFLERLPLTTDGAVDRASLPAPAPAAAPETWGDVETELAALWEELLGRRPTALDDDFFTLGGSSLLAVRLLAPLRERWGDGLPLSELFVRPDLAGMAAAIRRSRPRQKPSLLQKLTGWARRAPATAGSPLAGASPTRRST